MNYAKASLLLFSCMLMRGQESDPHAGHHMPAPEKRDQHQGMDHQMPEGMHMPGMDMPGMDMSKMNVAEDYLMRQASGTSMNPEAWPMPMLMPKLGSWNLMLMGQAFIVETQQTGPRGGDKLYSANWFMAGATHKLGQGSVMFETMLSLDPATVTGRSYPLLFQTGETAYGKPLVDAQHPHDFVMNLGVHYAHPLGENAMWQIYYAPVGDPALGPVAYPHRASAMELPQATLGHHWQDSSHIANNVLTMGVKYGIVRLEASGFYGTEPNENRWNIDWGPMNSWSGRLSVMPTKNWSAQISAGRLAHPERQEAGDVVRSTASVTYSLPTGHHNSWSSNLIWGRNHNTATGRNLNSYLFETVVPWRTKNFFTGRAELVDKDELFSDDGHEVSSHSLFPHGAVYRIGSYTAGYTRDFDLVRNLETGLGFNVSAYSLPSAIQPVYGGHPVGVNVFLRVRLKPAE